MNIKKYVSAVVALLTLAIFAVAIPAYAEDNNTQGNQPNVQGNDGRNDGNNFGGMERGDKMGGRGMMGRGNMMKPVVLGTVSAISGNTITISGRQGFTKDASATTFTVDVTNAKILKDNTAGTVTSIVVGDMIAVEGTVTGTNVVATVVHDGVMHGGPRKMENKDKEGQDLSGIVGNGQPVVAGTVTTINGNTLTITNKSNVTYTVDISNAKISKGPKAASIADVAVNDTVIVQGAVNGNSIVASVVIDTKKPVSTTSDSGDNNASHQGFFGGVGSFFAHMFGF